MNKCAFLTLDERGDYVIDDDRAVAVDAWSGAHDRQAPDMTKYTYAPGGTGV